MGPKLGPQKWVQNCSCNHSCKFHHKSTHTHRDTHLQDRRTRIAKLVRQKIFADLKLKTHFGGPDVRCQKFMVAGTPNSGPQTCSISDFWRLHWENQHTRHRDTRYRTTDDRKDRRTHKETCQITNRVELKEGQNAKNHSMDPRPTEDQDRFNSNDKKQTRGPNRPEAEGPPQLTTREKDRLSSKD